MKCYLYTRVSTIQQVDGYSLDAQETRLEEYAAYRDLEIVGKYCDAGYSGKSIKGRPDFLRMFHDIKSEKDDISFVLVFKLSRFGRNAADVLKSMQVLTDYGIDLVSVEDGIDSSTSGGRFTLTVLSAVAEIERENITSQLMAGKIQSIKSGNRYGGPIPYGYRKKDGKTIAYEEEAKVVRLIFDLFVNKDFTISGVAQYLNEHGFIRDPKNKDKAFDQERVGDILAQPLYCGRIVYGRNSREYRQTKNEDCLIIVKGNYEPLISEELFDKAQEKKKAIRTEWKKKSEESEKNEEISVLGGIVKCPICGGGLVSRARVKKNINHGGNYQSEREYFCRNYRVQNGRTCSYNKRLDQRKIDAAVFEIIGRLDLYSDFTSDIEKILGKEGDLEEQEKKLNAITKKRNLILAKIEKNGSALDLLDINDPSYDKKYDQISDRIDKLYDDLDEVEDAYEKANAGVERFRAGRRDVDSIRELVTNFNSVVPHMTNAEKREYCRTFIERVDVFEERQEDGRILKSITFRFELPDMTGTPAVTVDCTKMGLTKAEAKATYTTIMKYVKDKYGVNIHSQYIGQIKTKYGIEKRPHYNFSKKEKPRIPICPKEKEAMIVEALKHYLMLDESVELMEEDKNV